MPPCYDIYGLSDKRDKETIERFLDHFCYRSMIENREGQEIGILKNDKYRIDEINIPVSTLSEVIDYGMNHPNHGLAFYIGDSLKDDINFVILKFTYDGKIIFGVSIEEKRLINENELADNYDKAKAIEKQIARLTNSTKTSIQFEYAPSDDEEQFDSDSELWKSFNLEKQNK